MLNIIGVHFQKLGKLYYFDPAEVAVKKGDTVIVDTQNGPEIGICHTDILQMEPSKVPQPLKPVLRIATTRDKQTQQELLTREKEAFNIAQQKIAEHKLDMKLVAADYTFDGSKLIFFFTAEERVDFRALVRDLASLFHRRIELRQIGVRDEAQLVGGLGVCGRPTCCSVMKSEFVPVSIKMAKEQGLPLNPAKISGVCGRLMCCLKHEQVAYADLRKNSPPVGARVETPDGLGVVKDVNLLRERVKVLMDKGDHDERMFKCCDICRVKGGEGKGGHCGKHGQEEKPQASKDNTEGGTPTQLRGKPSASDDAPSFAKEGKENASPRNNRNKPRQENEPRTREKSTAHTLPLPKEGHSGRNDSPNAPKAPSTNKPQSKGGAPQ
ncbi:MAG: stage 0 sporulation family protein [Oscillospiraceae bacterium]|nr:stage 0 sporulation family protein [Oscillospiraceae bacterium]